jgi:hypothetical protein
MKRIYSFDNLTRIRQLMTADPEYRDYDLMKEFGLTPYEAQQLLDQQEPPYAGRQP